MLVAGFFIVALSVLLLVWYYSKKEKYKVLDKLPGPPVKWFSGNITEFGSDCFDFFHACQRMIKTYGRLVRIWQGPLQMNLFITDPSLVEYFLSSTIHINKSQGYQVFKTLLGNGLITGEGDIWAKHRKILTSAFHFNVLEQFASSFHRNAQILVDVLKRNSDQAIDTHPIMKNYALDSLCEAAMAVNFHSQKDDNNVFSTLIHKIMRIYMRRFFSLFIRFDFIFCLTPEAKTFRELLQKIQDITMEVIRKRRKEKLNNFTNIDSDQFGIKERKVFLDVLLERPEFTDKEVEWQANTFLFAGHDTIGACISFSIYLLAQHPEVQRKLLSEINEVIGEDRDKVIPLSALKKLNYLDRVLKECMRLYPPVSLFEREVIEDVHIGDLKIPKGTTVSFHPYSQHRDSELFPDPEKFDPDRFLPENTLRRHPFAYIPFSAGPRNCIGQKYAVMNAKTALVNIIRNFYLYPADLKHVPVLGNNVVLVSKNGLPVKFVYRC